MTARPSTSTPARDLSALIPALLSAFALLGLAWFFSGCKGTRSEVKGKVTLSAELAAKMAPTAALYVIARPEGVTSGPPLAVKRFVQPLKFPLEFTLTGADVMVPNTPFEGRVSVTARLSQSGAAMPGQSGDVESTATPDALEVGKGDVTLSLDRPLGAPAEPAPPPPQPSPSATPSDESDEA